MTSDDKPGSGPKAAGPTTPRPATQAPATPRDEHLRHGAEGTAAEDGADGSAAERDYGFGRSRPPTEQERARMAREQGELIASGKSRKGIIILNTPLRRTIFISGLVGAVVLGLVLAVAG